MNKIRKNTTAAKKKYNVYVSWVTQIKGEVNSWHEKLGETWASSAKKAENNMAFRWGIRRHEERDWGEDDYRSWSVVAYPADNDPITSVRDASQISFAQWS